MELPPTGLAQLSVGIFMAVFALSIALWDVWFLWEGVPQDTVSGVIAYWSRSHPVVPFVAGVLIGHLFLPIQHLLRR